MVGHFRRSGSVTTNLFDARCWVIIVGGHIRIKHHTLSGVLSKLPHNWSCFVMSDSVFRHFPNSTEAIHNPTFTSVAYTDTLMINKATPSQPRIVDISLREATQGGIIPPQGPGSHLRTSLVHIYSWSSSTPQTH